MCCYVVVNFVYIRRTSRHACGFCMPLTTKLAGMTCSTTSTVSVQYMYVALHRDLGWAELAPRGVWCRPLFEFASKVHAAAAVSWPQPHLTKYLFIQIRSDLAKRRILYKHDPWTNVTGPAGCRRCSNPSAGPAPCLHSGAH